MAVALRQLLISPCSKTFLTEIVDLHRLHILS